MATELATAYISIVPDTSRIGPGIRSAMGSASRDAAASGEQAGRSFGDRFGGVLKKGGLAVVTTAAATMATAFTKGFNRYVTIDAAEAKLRGLGKTSKEVASIIDTVKKTVSGTSFSTQEFADAAAIFTGMEISGSKLESTLKTLANTAASASGSTVSELQGIFQKVIANNGMTLETFDQLNERVAGFGPKLAKEMGIPFDQVREKVTDLKPSTETVFRALDKATGNTAKEMGKTFQGAKDNMVNSLGVLGEALLSPVMRAAPPVFEKITEGVKWLSSNVGPMMERVKEAFGGLDFNFSFDGIGDAFAGIWDAVKGPLKSIKNTFVEDLAPTLGRIIGIIVNVGSIMGTVFSVVAPILGRVAGIVGGALVGGFNILGNVLGGLSIAIQAATGWLAQHETVVKAIAITIGVLLLPYMAILAVGYASVAAAAVMSGIRQAGAWAMSSAGAIRAAAVSVAQSYRIVGAWALMGATATKNAAITAAGWLATTAGSTLATVRTAAYAVAMGVVRGATMAWTGAQWLLNAAMSANPIGIIIAIIVALVAAIVVAYRNSETFRNIVTAAWNGIKAAIGAVWSWLSTTVWPFLQNMFKTLGSIAMWLWQSVMLPVWNGIKFAIQAWWTGVQIYFSAFMSIIRGIGAVAMWLWNNAIVPAFNGIKAAITFWWSGVVVIFNFFKAAIQGLGAAATWIWQKMAQVWNAIKSVITTVVSAIAGAISNFVSRVIGFFTQLGSSVLNAVKSMWDTVKNAFSTGVDTVVNIATQLKDRIVNFFSGAARWLFDAGKDIVQGIIDGIKSMLSSLGDTIGSVADKVKSVASFGLLAEGGIVPGYASGGPVPGLAAGGSTKKRRRGSQTNVAPGGFVVNAQSTRKYGSVLRALVPGGRTISGPGSGTSDSIAGTHRGNVTAMVSSGEFYVPPEYARSLLPVLLAINAGSKGALDQFGIQKLAKGGIVSPEEMAAFVRGKRVRGYQASRSLEGAPYVWGGSDWGDCSGAQSALAAFALGLNPFPRKFATASQGAWLRANGGHVGKGPAGSFRMGWSPEHTSGTLPDGTNVEMGGGRGNGQIGGSAAPWNHPQFTNWGWVEVGPRKPSKMSTDGINTDTDFGDGGTAGSTGVGSTTSGGNSGTGYDYTNFKIAPERERAYQNDLKAAKSANEREAIRKAYSDALRKVRDEKEYPTSISGWAKMFAGDFVEGQVQDLLKVFSASDEVPLFNSGRSIYEQWRKSSEIDPSTLTGKTGDGSVSPENVGTDPAKISPEGATPAGTGDNTADLSTFDNAAEKASNASKGNQPVIKYDPSKGAEQWRPLAEWAINYVNRTMKGPAQTSAMVGQIHDESGGNPNAQNNYDINAQNGDPSVGLLQIIKSTFEANRDPKLPNDRRDPAANLVACLRYYAGRYGRDLTTRWGRGKGGYASGGSVWGKGSGTSDSIPAWLSNGEFVVNAAAANRNRGVLAAINSGMNIEPASASRGGPQVTYNIQAGNTEKAFSEAQRMQKKHAAAGLNRF